MSERLRNFPISFFAVVMGLAGAAVAWQRTEALLNWQTGIGTALLWMTAAIFLILFFLYLLKFFRYREEIKKEFKNITKLSFFPTLSISLLLLGIAAMDVLPGAARILWIVGTAVHFLFSVAIISIWIRHPSLEINHISPAWFIPVVGNILVPIAGAAFAAPEVSWFFFSVGLIFWVALFTILLYRLIFHNPLPERLLPTLFILIAPPAVGFIAYVKLTGGLDGFARILYYFGLFVFILMIPQLKMLSRISYYLSWWAYTFPMAALTIATILMYHASHLGFFKYLALVLLVVLSCVVALLAVMTLSAIKDRRICVED
ncbi:MAG: SLAC1 anion channel family protein [Deltaproteobacteria bacterium]|jgi:tellurite resistance protein|nr:SLAC1 anion channel family protein [Syntrophaceae bacterium]